MDETPIKAGHQGRAGPQKGKMKTGWFWPLYGDDDEVVFTYSNSRGRLHIEQVLNDQFSGTLISDGYAAYARYAAAQKGITHAQCWVHYPESVFIRSKTPECSAYRRCSTSFVGIKYRLEFRDPGVRCSSDSRRPSRAKPMWQLKGGAWRDYQPAHCTRRAVVRSRDMVPIPV